MSNKKTLVLLAGIFTLSVAFYISASTTFMVLLLGFILVPPALMVSAAIAQGFSIVSESLSKSGKENTVISV
ncbi:MAG: hypothetical protein PHH85_07655 [Candidatus Methanoperedens sp.]|nr:hypothetical protein [Candidatus Methanoperedens sp.]